MISTSNLLIAAIVVVAIVTIILAAKPIRGWWRTKKLTRAIRDFRLQRERMEARFFDMAASLGKPRGLRWLECDWQDAVTFARMVDTGLITAFVAVHISFEAIEGGDMEDVAAVDAIRSAAAVFHYRAGRWGTGGRALFNMDPHQAIERLEGQYEPIVLEEA